MNNMLTVFFYYLNRWKGDLMWGVAIGEKKVFSLPSEKTTNNKQNLVVLMSQSEKTDVQKKFRASCSVQHAAGAGYKLLCVNQGIADAYVFCPRVAPICGIAVPPTRFFWHKMEESLVTRVYVTSMVTLHLVQS